MTAVTRTAPAPASLLGTVYECGECGERSLERRCPDCHLFTTKLGPGGPCPHCDELVLMIDLQQDDQDRSSSYTEDLTSSHRTR